jgi:hypothetical protein
VGCDSFVPVRSKLMGGAGILMGVVMLAPGVAGASGHQNPPPGLGATLKAWTAAYHADNHECAKKSCFGPATHGLGSGIRFQYAEVATIGGKVIAYVEAFAPKTSLATAEAKILKTLPGAKAGPLVVVTSASGGCGQVAMTGAKVGTVGVEFTSYVPDHNGAYSPTDVQNALVAEGGNQAGEC